MGGRARGALAPSSPASSKRLVSYTSTARRGSRGLVNRPGHWCPPCARPSAFRHLSRGAILVSGPSRRPCTPSQPPTCWTCFAPAVGARPSQYPAIPHGQSHGGPPQFLGLTLIFLHPRCRLRPMRGMQGANGLGMFLVSDPCRPVGFDAHEKIPTRCAENKQIVSKRLSEKTAQ